MVLAVETHLFKVSFHGFVSEQRDRLHEIPDKHKVTFSLQVEGDNAVKVTTFHSQLLLRPLK